MSKYIKITLIVIAVFCLVSISVTADSSLSYEGYNYDAYGISTPVPEGYEPVEKLDGNLLGCGAFKNPQDIMKSDEGNIYIADTGNNRIVILNKDYQLVKVLNTVEINGINEEISAPTGVFAFENSIYIVQSERERVLRCDENGKVLSQFLRPVNDIFSDEMNFTPTKVLVNRSGTVYILVKNFVYGALTYSPEGDFLNFYGSNKVTVNFEVLLSYFWKQVMSQQQIDQMQRYVPIEYTNFCIDTDNFIYTVTNGAKKQQVRKLNTLGENVLVDYERNISRHTGNFGDLESGRFKGVKTANSFVDIAVDENGFMNILDQSNGRIFQFDPEGKLMHIFGGNGNVGYGFKNAVSIECIRDKIVVLDSEKNSLTIFAPTEYGSLVTEAVMLYNGGFYSEAKLKWQEIITKNQNFELAYDGLGKAAFEEGNYKEAMEYLKLAYNRDAYSDAFEEYRNALLRKALPYIATTIAFLAVIYSVLKKKLKFKLNFNTQTLKVLIHPSDEAFEMKYHKKFSKKIICISLFFMFLSIIFTRQLTSFVFNTNNLNEGNMWVVLFVVLFVFVAFCTVNWCITSLFDGKGSFKEIACSVAYSLIPYIAASYLAVALSYFLIADEGIFMSVISVIGLIWSGFVLVSTLRSIHEYSFSKTIISILLTLLGVLILIFIGILFIVLLQQIISFFQTIYNELLYR